MDIYIRYNLGMFPNIQPGELPRMFHHEGDQWVDITIDHDLINLIVHGRVSGSVDWLLT